MRIIPGEDASEGSTEYHAAPHSSEGGVTRLELERQLSVLLAAQTERGRLIAQLTDELGLVRGDSGETIYYDWWNVALSYLIGA